MLAPSSRRRWGRLQLQTLRAFIALDGRALTSELAGWCWPELVLVGGKPSWWQLKARRRRLSRSVPAECGALVANGCGGCPESVWKNPSEIESCCLNKTAHF